MNDTAEYWRDRALAAEAQRDTLAAEYERLVTGALDFTLPAHSDTCDGNETDGACLRCLVMAHVQVAYGFARPGSAALAAVEPPEGRSTELYDTGEGKTDVEFYGR